MIRFARILSTRPNYVYVEVQRLDDVWGWTPSRHSGSSVSDAIRQASAWSVKANSDASRAESDATVKAIMHDYATRTYHGD